MLLSADDELCCSSALAAVKMAPAGALHPSSPYCNTTCGQLTSMTINLNIVRLQNCPDITIFNSLFVFASGHHSDHMFEGSQVSKVSFKGQLKLLQERF